METTVGTSSKLAGVGSFAAWLLVTIPAGAQMQQFELPPYTPPMPTPAVTPPPEPPLEPVPPKAPPAQETKPNFGDKGLLVLLSSIRLDFGHLGYYGDSSATSFSASFQPGVDYFVDRNLSIGVSLFFRYSNTTSALQTEDTSFAAGAYLRLGVNIPMVDAISWWPVASLGAWQVHSTLSAPRDGLFIVVDGTVIPLSRSTDLTDTAVVTELYAPLLIHAAPHFFVGIGPDVYVDLSHNVGNSSNQRAFIGVSSTVGGWF